MDIIKPLEPKTFNNIYYNADELDDKEQTLDLHIPAKDDFPTLIFIHGGGWSANDKEEYRHVGNFLSQHGIGCASVNYRLSPRVIHPTHVQDCARACNWVKDNITDFGGNGKFYIAGHSAGAHLASLLVCDNRYLKRYGMSEKSFMKMFLVSGIYLINYNISFYGLGGVFKGTPRPQVSPINYLRPGLPPALVLYAERDLITFDRQAKNFHKALQSHGNRSKLMFIPNNNHGNIIDNVFESHGNEILKFLTE